MRQIFDKNGNLKVTKTIVTVNTGVSEEKVFNEIPIGIVNGSNIAFESAFPFLPDTLEVYIECIKLVLIDDYTITGPTTISLVDSPLTGETIYFNYSKA